jgi:hypothetical protein
MAWLSLVNKLEWAYSMLKDIWECKKTVFFGDDIPNELYSRTILLTPEDFSKSIVMVLFIAYVRGFFG